MATEIVDQEGDKLTLFLRECLKKEERVTKVKAKLDEEDIDYDDLFELKETDLRKILEKFGVDLICIGLIIKAFAKIDGSGVSAYPSDSGMGGFVVLSEEHNKFILDLSKNKEKIQQNIEKLKSVSDGIEQSAKKVSSEINKYYDAINKILSNLQRKRLNELEAVKNKKMEKIKQASIASNEALKFLAKCEDDFKRILGDKKVQMTAKHIAMSQYIENAKTALKKYSLYFDDNVQIPTSEKIEYAVKNKQVFEDFVKGTDEVIDCDVDLRKLEVIKNEIVMDWKSDLKNNENTIFFLEFVEPKMDKNDDEKTADCEWKSFEKLEANQTKVSLDGKALKSEKNYKFRMMLKVNEKKMFSKVLNVKTPIFKRLRSEMITIDEDEQLMKWIDNSKQYDFNLLFKGTRDGFAAAEFHKKCDEKGSTISIVKSENNNHLFGGFVSKSWNQNSGYARDDSAWLYSLRNTKGTPKKFKIVNNQTHAMYGRNGYGPTYGENFDLYISNNCNANSSSYSYLGYSYEGSSDPHQLNGGTMNFKVLDYEVWQIVKK